MGSPELPVSIIPAGSISSLAGNPADGGRKFLQSECPPHAVLISSTGSSKRSRVFRGQVSRFPWRPGRPMIPPMQMREAAERVLKGDFTIARASSTMRCRPKDRVSKRSLA